MSKKELKKEIKFLKKIIVALSDKTNSMSFVITKDLKKETPIPADASIGESITTDDYIGGRPGDRA